MLKPTISDIKLKIKEISLIHEIDSEKAHILEDTLYSDFITNISNYKYKSKSIIIKCAIELNKLTTLDYDKYYS